jgi:hypothetical protein
MKPILIFALAPLHQAFVHKGISAQGKAATSHLTGSENGNTDQRKLP